MTAIGDFTPVLVCSAKGRLAAQLRHAENRRGGARWPIATIGDQVDAQRMSEDSLHWLMQWYLGQCDDDWEHSYGVSIGTLDNPGWTLKIDLRDTGLEDRPFLALQFGESASNLDDWHKSGSWYFAKVEDGKFEGACGPTDLPALIQVFRQWVERTGS